MRTSGARPRGKRFRKAEIYRDGFGVPHVFAVSLADSYFGLGYCAAQDRPRTLPLHQLMLEGRLAEHLGNRALPDPGLPFLDGLVKTPLLSGFAGRSFERSDLCGIDRWMRTFDYIGAARESLAELGPRSQTIVEAFCEGVDHYYRSTGTPTPLETYAPETELGWLSAFEHAISLGFSGSNAFALSPSRAETGAVYVSGDPHYWFFAGHSEAHIVCPDLDLSGVWDGHLSVGIWGGTNRFIAVQATAAGLEGSVVYQERVNPEDREEYWDFRSGGYLRFERRATDIRVAGDSVEQFVARRSERGPVVGEALIDGSPVAYVVWSPFVQHLGRQLEQQLELWTKRTVPEFLAYLSDAEYVRGHRIVGDQDGNIGYACNGPVPVRDETLDWSTPVDATSPATALSSRRWRSGAAEFGFPTILNPRCGFVQSANDPPWVATVGSSISTDFPKYVFPDGWRRLGTRGARQRRLLSRPRLLGTGDIRELLFDVFVPSAHMGLKALRRRFEGEDGRDQRMSANAMTLDRMLARWDGAATRDSSAMTIAFFLDRLLEGGIPEPTVRVTSDPHREPEIREPTNSGYEPAYTHALEEVAERLLSTYGTLDKPWGEVHVYSGPEGDVGLPGGANSLRALFGAWSGWWDSVETIDEDGVQRCNFGSRTPRLTQLKGEEISVWSVTFPGQLLAAEHAGSRHVTDQVGLYAALEMKLFPLERPDIELASREDDHVGCNHRHFALISNDNS